MVALSAAPNEVPVLFWLAWHRRPLQTAVDALAWMVAWVLADGLRYDLLPPAWVPVGLAVLIPVAVALQFIIGFALHLYRGRYRFGAFEEVATVAAAVVTVSTASVVLNLELSSAWRVPRSVPAIAGLLALVLMVGVRYAWRLFLESRRRPDEKLAEPLLVFGAGEGGDQAIQAMLRDPSSPYLPVGILDDDPRKANLRIRGVRVMGSRADLRGIIDATGARVLLLAVPSAGAELVREIRALADQHGLDLKILPAVAELASGFVQLTDIRDLDLADLLGRRQIELNLDEIAGYLTGRRVLVTGAGGSIGSELCRQLLRFRPAELIMLDRDESALHAVQLSITGRAMLDSEDLVLADIRDIQHMQAVFEQRRPQVVFHAAALKHLTLLERFPGEAVKSNVWGTVTVLEAAKAVGVERFVNISTDKAADPISVLGYSKRIAERLTSHASKDASGVFMSVRFGNVLGSRGSVLTAFAAQVASGGPVTVTDPDVTRYFMTIQEAVQLVIQAGSVGGPGEALVLDMGEPVSIDQVARQLAAFSNRKVDIVYTGLRPGEKVHETLIGASERDVRPQHPLISHVAVPPLSAPEALGLDPWASNDDIITQLRGLAKTLETTPVRQEVKGR